jgi:hypothetical protein
MLSAIGELAFAVAFLGRAGVDNYTHKEKSPPEVGFSNYQLSKGGGSCRQVPWLVSQV